jgi:putative aminopeptidase FrvX
MHSRPPRFARLTLGRLQCSALHTQRSDIRLEKLLVIALGGIGGSYASHTLPGDLTLALEVGPTEAGYGTTNGGGPSVGYGDAQCVYDKGVADQLISVATELEMLPQAAPRATFESDASHAKASGLSPRVGLLRLPTLSPHGYEVIRRDAI